jgi:multiple sugar transport system permease protein
VFKDTNSGRWLRKNILIGIASFLVLAYVLGPIYWIVNTSFQSEAALDDRPPHLLPTASIFTLSNYSRSLQMDEMVLPAIFNSLIISLMVTLINLLIGFPAGHVFARFRFLGHRKVFLLLMATRLLPSISLLVPLYILLRILGLLDTKISLIGIYSAVTIPFTIWIMRAYFVNIPIEYEEAARMDGCGYLRSLIKIVVPLARSGIVAAAIFAFMTSYEEFVFASILTQTMNSKTSSVILARMDGGGGAAAATLCFLPPVLVAIIFRKQVLDGLTARISL